MDPILRFKFPSMESSLAHPCQRSVLPGGPGSPASGVAWTGARGGGESKRSSRSLVVGACVFLASLATCAVGGQTTQATGGRATLAQGKPSGPMLAPGSRVRIQVPAQVAREFARPGEAEFSREEGMGVVSYGPTAELVGNLLTLDETTINLRLASGTEAAFSRDAIQRLEVSRSRSHRGQSAALGLLIGAGLGAVIAGGSSSGKGLDSPGFAAAGGAMVFGTVGCLVGMAMGGERWEVVKLDSLKLGLAPNPRGAGVSLSFSF